MHPASAPDAALANSGTHPCVQSGATHAGAGSAAADSGVGQERLGHSLSLLGRVGRVIHEINAGRTVTDQELLAHEKDCRLLSEEVYARFEATGNPADRDEAVLWQHRAAEARRSLSPAWKAAREAQIQQAIGQGTGCYFMDSADVARARRTA